MKIRRKCKCGCGRITNYGKKYVNGHRGKRPFVRKIRRRCKCGCGRITRPGNKYILGHSRKGKTSWNKGPGKTKIRRRCKCGCGEITNPGRKWIYRHYWEENGKIKIRRKCKCGCDRITNYGKRYVRGHNPTIFTKESKLKISVSHKGKKKSEEIKRKISKARKNNWQDPEYQKKQYEVRVIKPNKLELTLGRILNNLLPGEYKYVGDFQFWLGGKNPDFMNINGQKKLVELYGDYWHAGQDPQIRIDHFKQYGFNTLVIWEHELKKSRLQLRRKLIDFHIK